MDSLRGHLLIAPPYLADPNFSHAVVLVIQHDDEGAFGVVLNRPSGRSIREVWQEVRGAPCRCDQPVNVGGPVTGPLVALHGEPALGEVVVAEGLYCTMGAEGIEEIVDDDRRRVRFYAGYSGWGAGQLEAELQTGSWLTLPAKATYVFDLGEDALWPQVTREAAGAGAMPPLDFGEDRGDPSRN